MCKFNANMLFLHFNVTHHRIGIMLNMKQDGAVYAVALVHPRTNIKPLTRLLYIYICRVETYLPSSSVLLSRDPEDVAAA